MNETARRNFIIINNVEEIMHFVDLMIFAIVLGLQALTCLISEARETKLKSF